VQVEHDLVGMIPCSLVDPDGQCSAEQSSPPSSPTIADILRDVKPMGDLSRFLVEEMTPEEEDEFFSILENT
jgi:hypothetical protein